MTITELIKAFIVMWVILWDFWELRKSQMKKGKESYVAHDDNGWSPCSIRYFVPTKISPALPLCHNHHFCDRVHLYYFCLLLNSRVSTIAILTSKQLPRPTV